MGIKVTTRINGICSMIFHYCPWLVSYYKRWTSTSPEKTVKNQRLFTEDYNTLSYGKLLVSKKELVEKDSWPEDKICAWHMFPMCVKVCKISVHRSNFCQASTCMKLQLGSVCFRINVLYDTHVMWIALLALLETREGIWMKCVMLKWMLSIPVKV
mgnify:CR=1 FL=1